MWKDIGPKWRSGRQCKYCGKWSIFSEDKATDSSRARQVENRVPAVPSVEKAEGYDKGVNSDKGPEPTQTQTDGDRR